MKFMQENLQRAGVRQRSPLYTTIEKAADIISTNKYGKIPLMIATREGHQDIVDILTQVIN